MGCDIHLYKEKKVNNKWISADEGWKDKYDEGYQDVDWNNRFTDRDYNLFGFLSEGVRRNHKISFKARGIPFNVCDEVKALVDRWDCDGHSHSYLYLSELKDAWESLSDKTITISGMKDNEGIKLLNESIESNQKTNWDLLYPYCQMTNSPGHSDFEVEVPATHSLSSIQTIIGSFDGIDGDDHRIVFWFDN